MGDRGQVPCPLGGQGDRGGDSGDRGTGSLSLYFINQSCRKRSCFLERHESHIVCYGIKYRDNQGRKI